MTNVPENAFVRDLDKEGATAYLRLRPAYPPGTLTVLGSALRDSNQSNDGDEEYSAVDIGAGSGQLTRLLAEAGYQTTAVEPSEAMRGALEKQSWVHTTGTRVLNRVAEATGLPSQSTDLVTWAQCFHWLDAPQATEEAARILRPKGVAAVIANQLDVRHPWVHRLTRIMRSGDVLERQKQPELGAHFDRPQLRVLEWTDFQTPEEVLELGRTRSSYLSSSLSGRLKMQQNLSWYLFDRLGFYPEESIELPYRTFIWTAPRRETPTP